MRPDGAIRRFATRFQKGATILLAELVTGRQDVLRDYFSAISGSAGRLVFSLVYFVVLASTLSIPDFGIFATASATGVMLSRLLAFGFVTPLYRIATVKPRLLGVYTTGFLLLSILSLPLVALAALGFHRVFFAQNMAILPFALVIAAEAVFWRPAEAIVIVNNGLNRFARGAVLVVVGTMMRAAAAIAFALASGADLLTWTGYYLIANAAALALGIAFFQPRCRLRLRPALYWRRMADSLNVAGAEVLFYLQMELDKLLVLAIGGPGLAGIYAIIMRLVDLTAIPVRTFSMLLVQHMMRAPETLARLAARAGIEGGIFAVSTLGLATLAVMLHFFPRLLGGNVAEVAPLLFLVLLVPGLRNLVEYQAELLFARGQTLVRAINLALLGAAKAVLLAHALERFGETEALAFALNGVFAALYVVSALLTYSALRMPAKRV